MSGGIAAKPARSGVAGARGRFSSISKLVLAASLVGMVACGSAPLRAAPQVHPGDDAVDAAALVREVRASEAWIDTVKSLRLKAELVWLAPPAAGGNAVAPTPVPVPERPESLAIGFDDHRLSYRKDAKEYQLISHRTWDGKVAVMHSKYSPKEHNQEQYLLDKELWPVGEFFLGDLGWPRAGPHKHWWVRERGVGDDLYGGDPEDFRLVGREKFRGVECYVVESDLYYRTLYVGIADQRLYGLTNGVLTRFSSNSREPISRAIAKDMGGEVKTRGDFSNWFSALTPDEKKHYWKEYFRRLRPFSRPQATHWYGEYKEVAAGCWMPMHQGYDLWSNVEDPMVDPAVTKTHDIRITEVIVNQPLPDQLFVWEFTEGVEVADRRGDLLLFYKYKKHFEPVEWEAILDEAREQKARRRPGSNNMALQIKRADALGKPAPEFPDATWINSKPLKLADIAGKVVIVECWASWSKFCREDIAKLNDLYEHGKDGIVIISVHAAGTPVDELRKWVQENGVKYPVCIDTPGDKGPWEGTLFNAYHVMDVPNVYVINRQGKVTLEGMLIGAVPYAVKATTKPAPTNRPPGAGAAR
jgi:thiol-disulfide isomerase/thioredoxin